MIKQIKCINREIKSLQDQRNKIEKSIEVLRKDARRIALEHFKKTCRFKVNDNVRAERYGGIFIRGKVIGYEIGYDQPQVKVLHKRGGCERWELFREESLSRIESVSKPTESDTTSH